MSWRRCVYPHNHSSQVTSQSQTQGQSLLAFSALHMELSLMTTGWLEPRGGADPPRHYGVLNATWLDQRGSLPPN